MVFSSIPFLYYYLPFVVIIYYLIPKKCKNLWMLLASLFFYGWGEPKFLLAMIFTITQGYIFGRLIEKNNEKGNLIAAKFFMLVSVVLSLALLFYCKYKDFFADSFNKLFGTGFALSHIALPIGISFYTFQMLSYIIDVYKSEVKAQKSYINLALYISMFPQLIAGPIVRYDSIEAQLTDRILSVEKTASGVRRFVIGLSKKVLIANVLSEVCVAFKSSDEKSILFFWLYAVAYTIHVYFDFSGYSDMAIGLGRIFGFEFTENFNYPYISRSITEFWRRWHISLGSWFRDYVYIPLGGNKVSTIKWIRNVFVVWMLTGLWHGAAWNFVVWGLIFGIMLTIEKLFLGKYLKKSRIVSRIYTLFVVTLSLVIFDAVDISVGLSYIKSMLGFAGVPLVSAESVFYLKNYLLLLIVGIIGSTPVVKTVAEKYVSRLKISVILEPVIMLGLLVVSTGFLVDGSFNPFLYFRF